MATKLVRGKPVVRETAIFERGVPLMIAVHSSYIETWWKGSREKKETPIRRVHHDGFAPAVRR